MLTLKTSFDLEYAKRFARACAQAYGNVPFTSGESLPHWIQLADAHCFYQDMGGFILISIRGTADIEDVITDGEFDKIAIPDAVPGVKVHRGFWISSKILATFLISNFIGNTRPMVIVGHSLGGAQAVHVARMLYKAGFDVAAVCTFGKPRVGNAAWRDAYNLILGRVTHHVRCAGDLVPLVPGIFDTPLDGYRHEGNEIFLSRLVSAGNPAQASWQLNPNHYFEIACDEWRTLKALRRGDVKFVTQFHSIQNDYQVMLERCLS